MTAVVVESLAEDFETYAAAAVDADEQQRRRLWDHLLRDRHPRAFDRCQLVNDDPGDRGATGGTRLAGWRATVRDRAAGLPGLADRVAGELAGLGLLDEAPVPVVLLAGSTMANGWSDDDSDGGDGPALMLELTQAPAPPFDRVLIAHEMTHVAHARHRPAPWPETVAARLFSEGLATAVSGQLAPDVSDGGLLWFDDGHEDWAAECRTAAPVVAARLREHLDSTDPAVHRWFFSAAPADAAGVPVRSGYHAGLVALRRLETVTGLQELAAWTSGLILGKLTDVLR